MKRQLIFLLLPLLLILAGNLASYSQGRTSLVKIFRKTNVARYTPPASVALKAPKAVPASIRAVQTGPGRELTKAAFASGNVRPSAIGNFTMIQRGANGKVYRYSTYHLTKTGFHDKRLIYDGGHPSGNPGRPHYNKLTGEDVPTPHVQGKDIPGGVRPPQPDEIPR